MLKRLIIAVLVLGLVIGLSNTAISGVPKGLDALNPVQKVNTNNPRFSNIADARPDQPAFKKPESALRKLPAGFTAPAPPQSYFCDVQDYTSGAPAYYWTIPDAYGDDLFNMRFTSEANYDCTLKVAHLLMYGDAMVGTPDMRVYLWDDDGFGFPGNKLDSVDIPNAALPISGLGYVSADFSSANWVFSDGAEYHYGWTTLGGAGDTLAIISDAADGPFAGEERASENYAGTWGTMLNDWGLDVSFFILSERCCSEIPFSDCYTQSYLQNLAYFWRAPHPTYGDEAYAQRFSVSGPETLQVVDIAIYDPGDGSFGNDDVIISVYDDDGAGLPGALVTSVTLPAGTYAAFPALTSVPFGIVMTNDFHIAFSSSATVGVDYESCLSSDGTDGTGRSSSYWAGGPWVDMLSGWGVDVNFYFEAYMCRDEYSVCSINSCYAGLGYYWRLPDVYGDIAQAQKFSAIGEECKVKEVTLALYWSRTESFLPLYSDSSAVTVYADAGGLPGAALASIIVGPAEYAAAGISDPGDPNGSSVLGFLTVDFEPLNVTLAGDYWVGIHSYAVDPDHGIRTLSDAGGGGSCPNAYAEYYGAWGLMWSDWGFPTNDLAMVIDVEHCCIPFTGRDCASLPITDWNTLQGNQGRTGASAISLSDSWCDLTMNWKFEHPTDGVSFTGPVVYDDRVVCAFGSEYRVFQLDGTPLYTYNPSGTLPSGNIRCAPTITTITGYPNPVMFVSGGGNAEVHAVDFNTGTTIWYRDFNVNNLANQRWGVFTVLNDNVYWGDDDGNVWGADALTGATLAGYPVALTQSTWISGATDGTQLFYATQASGVEGDIYAIDAATGAINWQLSTAGGLQAGVIYSSYNGDEGFTGGVAYDAGKLYANSRAEADFPTDGVFYRIDANNGSLVGPAIAANRVFYSTPIVDINRVYQPSLTRWAGAPAGGNLYAVNKALGTIDWVVSSASGGRYYANGVLSCEPEPDADQLYVFNEDGFLSCFNAETGDEIWRRRIFNAPGYAPNIGMSGALSLDAAGDAHLLFADFWGNLYDLTKQVDRPRLEIQSYNLQAAVEFGTAPSLLVTFPGEFVNTGCVDLVFSSVTADDVSSGQNIPGFASANSVNADLMDRANQIADKLARDAFLSKYLRVNEKNLTENDILSVRENNFEKSYNRAAAGFPAYLNGISFPTAGSIIAAGDTADLVIDVIQSAMDRGPHVFYITLCSNDPDFYLNDGSICPEILVNLVGGCLVDTTTLNFGMGGANYQWVTNTGRLATGDWDAHGWEIDGDGSSYYQGSYGWWLSTYRIATHSQDWTSGGGEADAFVSMQPDPNWCDNDCHPYLDAGVTLGYMTTDGGNTYNAIIGNMVCKTFLDSVQNFDLGGGWDWTNFGAPFDNDSTMGLYATGRVVGALDVPELANLTLEILEITERNGNAVDGWYMAEFFDCDNGGDEVNMDQSISAAWSFNTPAKDQAWGLVKIPFGCGYDPLINVWGTYGASGSPGHGFWDWNQYWDTAYAYCTSPPGVYGVADMHNGDEEAHITLAQHDFAPNETYKIGIAHFALFGLTDASDPAEYADLAHFVNKWAGFGRGDVNNDGVINLADIIYLAGTVNGGPGAVPFEHLSDVNADGSIDMNDVNYLIDYYFNCGACPMGDFIF